MAGLPFFIVTLTALGSSRFARHFTQYMLAIFLFTSFQKYYYLLRQPSGEQEFTYENERGK